MNNEEPNDGQALVMLQPQLFCDDVADALEVAKKSGRYTAELLKREGPDIHKAIIQLRGQGLGQLKLARTLGLHHRTVAALDPGEPEAIDMARERAIAEIRRAGSLHSERLNEHSETVPIHVAGLVAMQLFGLRQVVDGRASQRVEHVQRVDVFANFERVLSEPSVEKDLRAADVAEIALAIGLSADATKDNAAAIAGTNERGTDGQSLAPTQLNDGKTTLSTTKPGDRGRQEPPAPMSALRPARGGGGGGGVARRGGGPPILSVRRSQKFYPMRRPLPNNGPALLREGFGTAAPDWPG